MRLATVYHRNATFFLHADSQTTVGVWIFTEPCLAIPEQSDDQELERAVRVALDGSQTNVPHPRIWKGLGDRLLALAGVRTWNAFAKGAACVSVREDGARIVVVPTRNGGPKEGFVDDDARQVVLDEGTAPGALGAAVKRLLGDRFV